jgi:phage terminase small subunit
MATTPRGLRAAGRRLWTAVTSDFELDPPELELLTEACRTLDLITDLRAEAAMNGIVIASNQGVRVHPAVVEARQRRLALAKLLSALGLPKGLAEDEATA